MTIKLPKRNYVTFTELCDRWKCSENDIRELIIEEHLKPSFFLGELSGNFVEFKYDDITFGSRMVAMLRFEGGGGPRSNPNLFYLREPHRTAALDCNFKFCSWSYDSEKAESDQHHELDTMPTIGWCQLDESISLDLVLRSGVVTNIEIARFEEKMSADINRPLDIRERKTLLTIIAGLCRAADIDPMERGAASTLTDLVELIGATVDVGAVRTAISQIPEALNARMGKPKRKVENGKN